GWVVRFTYRCADTVLIQSQAFGVPVEKYAGRGKTVYFPNSFPLEGPPDLHESSLPADFVATLDSFFCAVFAGNIGSAQAMETLVEAASLLKDLPDVRIVLVGSGSKLEWVRHAIKERTLCNVVIAGRFPPTSMPEIFQRASCLLVTLKNEKIFSY